VGEVYVTKKLLNVYLAGPMTNCSERQKTVWRKRLKDALRTEFKCLDPTDPRARKGALAVSADIEEADVVIANMWRESIGTTLGIVQAKRMGIPVILIDQHCLDSPILKSLVGDCVVHSEEAAINKLRNEVAPSLTGEVQVVKRNGSAVPFDLKKLQKSLKGACLAAGVDDPIFHVLLSRRVQRAIVTNSDAIPITTKTIRDRVFQELRNISINSLGEGDAKQAEHANALCEAWEFHESLMKEQGREVQEKELEYLTRIEDLSGQLSELELEVENLRARLDSKPSSPIAKIDAAWQPESSDCVEVIRDTLGKKRALCLGRIGKTSFASAFAKRGIRQEDFAELFEEKLLDGKQSNLNADLKTYIQSYPYVLYAFDGLRHLHESSRGAPNLIVGAGPNDAVRRFLLHVSPTEA
jgi:ATP cone domain